MRTPKYPLDPLARVRAQHVDEATRELGATVRAREAAEEARAAAERRSEAHAANAAATREAERDALERGELRVADLARQDAWQLRVAAEREEHERRVAEARASDAAARDDEASARVDLATAKADEGAVGKHRAKWDAAEAKKRDAREEQAAEEAWRPRGEK